MLAHKIYWLVRDRLVALGVLERPRFYMQRHSVGTVRRRLVGSGRCRRIRRVSLSRLLGA
jgi:hypothetical protein